MQQQDDILQQQPQPSDSWESALPSEEELTPLTQSLISPELAIAFRISTPESSQQRQLQLFTSMNMPPPATIHSDKSPQSESRVFTGNLISRQIDREEEQSHALASPHHFQRVELPAGLINGSFSSAQFEINLRKSRESANSFRESSLFRSLTERPSYEQEFLQPKMAGKTVRVMNEQDSKEESAVSDSNMKKGQNKFDVGMEFEETEMVASTGGGASTSGEEIGAARTLKRPRLVWTPQLHKRFVEAVTHLGIKNAVPKTIMQLMNVEGLTRENVASHLQKYRLYLKKVRNLSSDIHGSSCSDPMFASAASFSPTAISSPATHSLPPLSRNDFIASPRLAFMASGGSSSMHRPQLSLGAHAPFKQGVHMNMAAARTQDNVDAAAFLSRASSKSSTVTAHAHSSDNGAVQENQENVSTSSSQGMLTLFQMSSR